MPHSERWRQDDTGQEVRPILPERSFQDPAFANFHESNQTAEKLQQKQKKKGFFSSLFKKPNKRKQPYGDDYIHIERRVENDETSDSDVDRKIQELHDQSPRFHILKQDSQPDDLLGAGSKPVVPMPGSTAHRQLFSGQEISPQQAPAPHIEHNSETNNCGQYSVAEQTQMFEHEQTFPSAQIWPESAKYAAEETAINEMIHQDTIDAFNSSVRELDGAYMQEASTQSQVDLRRRRSVGKPTDLDQLITQQQTQPSSERKLSISKPTNLDDLANHNSEFQPSFQQSNTEEVKESTFIPEHERTQEIDIDALLALPETPEETEEEVEAENLEYENAADNQDKQMLNQREIAIEQLRLEEEQRDLENQNMVLQQQLVEKENERLRDQTEVLNSMLVSENSLKYINEEHNGVQKEDTTQDFEQIAGNPKEQGSSEENADTDIIGKKKPKSFFNFNSFRKPKQKDRMSKSETETSGPSDTDHTPDETNKEFPQLLVEKRKHGMNNVFSVQKSKHRHSYHPALPEDMAMEDRKSTKVEVDTSESDENSKMKTKRKGVTNIFKSSSKPKELNQLPKQEDQELYPVVTENSRLSSSEDVSDDLATQIVREIQKSTTELNFKSQSMPKLNSNKANNKSSIPSMLGGGGLRMSMRKSKKKEIKEEEAAASSCNEDNAVEVSTANQDSLDSPCNKEELPDSRGRSHSLHQKREKKSTFGEIFGMRSSSRDRKHNRRGVQKGNVKTSEDQANGFESPAENDNLNDLPVHSSRTKKEAKPQTGLGALFGSNRQKKQRSKSQERKKNKFDDAEQFSDTASPDPERGARGVANLLTQTHENQNLQQSEPSTLYTQPRPSLQNRAARPTDKPPLPPSSMATNLSPDYVINVTDRSTPSPQTYTNNIKSAAINLGNQRLSPTIPSSQDMDIKREELLSASRLSHYSTAYQDPGEANSLNDSENAGKIRQTGRQSGRFRKSSTLSNISGAQTTSSNLQRQTSFSSQAATNDAQSMFMDSLIADPQSRPVTPHNPQPRKKPASVSRTESYRKARGQEDERPRVIKRNDTYNSLPRSKKQVRQLRAANSEDSLRNAIDREESASPSRREKSRQGKRGKEGECSVM
jgi:hypothetical protein